MSASSAVRENLLKEWASTRKGLEEAVELVETNPDEENLDLCTEFEQQLADCVLKLNQSERDLGIVPTPNTKFMTVNTMSNSNSAAAAAGANLPPLGASGANGTASAPPFPANSSVVCLYNDAAPYQVHFDGKKWYSCVIVSVEDPTSSSNKSASGGSGPLLDRIQYKVWVLGYNVEEVVLAEDLRRWQPDFTEPITAGLKVYAINPKTGRFEVAAVDKITPKNTVVVKFGGGLLEAAHITGEQHQGAVSSAPVQTEKPTAADVPLTSNAAGNTTTSAAAVVAEEVPISHILTGKWYSQLRKVEKLSAADKRAKAKERKAKQKEKNAERHRIESEKAFEAVVNNQDYLDL